MEQTNWMNDSRIAEIDQNKLEFLQKLVFELDQQNQKEKMSFLLALANRAKAEKISFEQEEVQLIITVIKDYSTPEEIMKMNKILAMFQSRKK